MDETGEQATIKLGLIGRGISKSLAPRLHRWLGEQHGLPVSYDLIDTEGRRDFDLHAQIDRCAAAGYHGVNITHPYKQSAITAVSDIDPAIANLGAINTVIFSDHGISGHNTDYSGFKRAVLDAFPNARPVNPFIAGCGGVGRAVAFALFDLGAQTIRIHDRDAGQMQRLADDLVRSGARIETIDKINVVEAMQTSSNICNCTPVGMHNHPGMPLPIAGFGRQNWVFEAIYTPLKTEFALQAERSDIPVLYGSSLFLFQGLDAFELFTGRTATPETIKPEVDSWFAAASRPS